jgi:hypothetical protein
MLFPLYTVLIQLFPLRFTYTKPAVSHTLLFTINPHYSFIIQNAITSQCYMGRIRVTGSFGRIFRLKAYPCFLTAGARFRYGTTPVGSVADKTLEWGFLQELLFRARSVSCVNYYNFANVPYSFFRPRDGPARGLISKQV